MSTSPKAFFGFLVTMMLFSVILSYEGITKQKQRGEWQMRYKADDYQYQTETAWFWSFTNKTIIYLDSTVGKLTSWTLLIIIPLTCGIWAFKFERMYLGLFTLLFCATFYSWIGMKLWLFDRFLPIIRM